MRILIDIGHPAHVHYFRNFIKIMENKGHKFKITARDKEVTFNLLNSYKIPYKSRGRGKKSLIGKLLYIFQGDWSILKVALKFKPDLFLSFGSAYAAHASFYLRKPHIAFDDTEHARFEHLMYVPFTSTIITPDSFYKNFGSKHIKFSGFMELCYLHSNYFKPNKSILKILDLSENDKFVLLRFVSWEASHDSGIKGIELATKIELIKELSKLAKVFVSSEGNLPAKLKEYELKIPPHMIHDALAYANLYIGEGATTASESVMLGTPAIYVNLLDAGSLREQSKYGLLLNMRSSENLVNKAIQLLKNENLKKEAKIKLQKMLSAKIDVTAFMVWFIENYPESVVTMKKNPNYQNRFI